MALYLMLSRTNTGMGKIIRRYTGATYNHVSMTLDPSLRSFVSFARYVEDVPLVGGYIREPAERFLCVDGPLSVRIFRLELDEQRERELASLFAYAGDRSTGLLYDSLSALISRWHIPGCYTCLGFAAKVLGRPFHSLQELERYLEPYEFFRGDLRELVTDSGDRSDPFFIHRGLIRGTGDTLLHFGRLLARLLRISKRKDITEDIRKD